MALRVKRILQNFPKFSKRTKGLKILSPFNFDKLKAFKERNPAVSATANLAKRIVQSSLNLPHEYLRVDGHEIPFYSDFHGRMAVQMPKLVGVGRKAMSAAGLMDRRIEVKNYPEEVRAYYFNNAFDLGDAIVSLPKKMRFKIDLDSEHLSKINLASRRKNRALILTEDDYNALDVEEFSEESCGKANKPLSREEAKVCPLWRVLARERARLDEYVELVFDEGKHRYGYEKAMSISPLGGHPEFAVGDTPELRAWYIDRLVNMSEAHARSGLGDDCSSIRLVGILPSLV